MATAPIRKGQPVVKFTMGQAMAFRLRRHPPLSFMQSQAPELCSPCPSLVQCVPILLTLHRQLRELLLAPLDFQVQVLDMARKWLL